MGFSKTNEYGTILALVLKYFSQCLAIQEIVQMDHPLIYIVDDNRHNLRLLEKILIQQDIRVSAFQEGRSMLNATESESPDLFLLDIEMPGMSGFDLCRAIKSKQALSGIPVIFISALTEIDSIKEGFELGGVDYITKPFRAGEVILRINNHLLVRSLQKKLESQNEHLEMTVRQRTAELEKANQMLTRLDDIKSDFLKFISHEMRAPLNGVIGVSELLINKFRNSLDKDFEQIFERSKKRTLSLIDDALLLNEIDTLPGAFEARQVPLNGLLENAIERTQQDLEEIVIDLHNGAPLDTSIQGDAELLVKAFVYVLETAASFSSDGNHIQLDCRLENTRIHIDIDVVGRTISGETISSFFKFFSDVRSSSYAEKMGLAPVVAARIIYLFDGIIEVSNIDEKGVRFHLEFPV